MVMLTEQQINERVDELSHDNEYINELIADMFDAEGHMRVITPNDVSRLKQIIFNKGYLKDIATDQLKDELCTAPSPAITYN